MSQSFIKWVHDIAARDEPTGRIICTMTAKPSEWLELCRLASLGAALEAMPKESSVKHVNLIALEPADHEWILKFYNGPGKPYTYINATTPQEVFLRLKHLQECGTPHGARPCPNDAGH